MLKSKAAKWLTRVTGPRKVLFYGNCQAQVTARAISIMDPEITVKYAGNSERVAEFNQERALRLMDWCDVMVSQPIMNRNNPDYHELLSNRLGDRLIFMPYIYCDDFFLALFCVLHGWSHKIRRGRGGAGHRRVEPRRLRRNRQILHRGAP